jgi:hypothetical protein
MDRILSVLGLALAIASLVPAFTTKQTKLKVVAIAIAVGLVGILGVQFYLVRVERADIEHAKEDVLRMMIGNRSMSFDQIYSGLNYVDYELAATAVDELVEDRQIHHRLVDVVSDSGAKYVVRVYNSVNFPIN